MIEELIKKSEELFKKIVKITKFHSRYEIFPYVEGEKIRDELLKLTDSIPNLKIPTNQNELLLSELKRRTILTAISLEYHLNKKPYNFDIITEVSGITRSDIAALSKWLKKERIEVLESIERLFRGGDIQNLESYLEQDTLSIENQKKSAEIDIQRYHKNLGKLIEEKTKVKEFLRQIKAVPTYQDHSYFSMLTKTIGIRIPDLYYTTENRNLQLKERELIRIYGHEGIGHALKCIVTNSKNLPYFQKGLLLTIRNPGETEEYLANFYRNVIFEDLKNSPETQRELGINNKFNKIYEEAKDINKLEEYKLNLLYYSTAIFADKIFGALDGPKAITKRAELIHDLLLYPYQLSELIEEISPHFDSECNFDREAGSQIISIIQPVVRALEEFKKRGILYDEKGRSKIDEAFLTGYWTPTGFIDNARLKAQE